MARIFGRDECEGKTRRVVGTYGYMAPEYAIDGHFSVKSDVFSFGVLVLEIISGKKNRSFGHPDHGLNLLGHAWRLWKEGKSIELVDEPMRSSCAVEDVLRCMHVGLLCVQKRKEERPTMLTVVLMLGTESLVLPAPKKPGDIQNIVGENKRSVLVFAVMYRHLNFCKMSYERCPELLYIADTTEHTPLHHAAWRGFADIVEFLISAAAEKEKRDASGIVQDTESGRTQEELGPHKLLMMPNYKKQTALHSAVLTNHLDCVKLLLKADPSNKLLRTDDGDNNTAMHIAVRDQKLEIVKLLLETDPCFAYAPNNDHCTPHLIAVQNSSAGDQTAVAIRNLLIEKQPHECKKQFGAKGWTLLHHATHRGDVASIEHILDFCPECVEMVDNEGQNFVHLAAMHEHEKVIRCILASSKLTYHVLNRQDKNGNTPLHIVASKGSEKVGLWLLYDSRVNKFAENNQKDSAINMIKFSYDKRQAGVYGLVDGVDAKEAKERIAFDLVVGALIATVSFTSGIMVPGGFFNDGPNKGNAILHSKLSFQLFVISNTIAFALSLYAVFCLFCTRHFSSDQNINYQLKVASRCSSVAIFAMMIAFITGSCAVLAISDWLYISVCVICSCFFGFAFYAFWRMVKEEGKRMKKDKEDGSNKKDKNKDNNPTTLEIVSE